LATILTSRATTHINAAKQALALKHPHPAAHTSGATALAQIHALVNHALVLAFGDTFRTLVFGAIIAAAMGLLLRRNVSSGVAEEDDEMETIPSAMALHG
jgi:hypothetical protein